MSLMKQRGSLRDLSYVPAPHLKSLITIEIIWKTKEMDKLKSLTLRLLTSTKMYFNLISMQLRLRETKRIACSSLIQLTNYKVRVTTALFMEDSRQVAHLTALCWAATSQVSKANRMNLILFRRDQAMEVIFSSRTWTSTSILTSISVCQWNEVPSAHETKTLVIQFCCRRPPTSCLLFSTNRLQMKISINQSPRLGQNYHWITHGGCQKKKMWAPIILVVSSSLRLINSRKSKFLTKSTLKSLLRRYRSTLRKGRRVSMVLICQRKVQCSSPRI